MFGLERLWTSKAPPPRLVLPPWQGVDTWEPPAPKYMPAQEHCMALINMANESGMSGLVPCHELVRIYSECAWAEGFVELTRQQILTELGARLTKSRPRMETAQGRKRVTCYLVPNFKAGNVVQLKVRRKAKRPALRSYERAGRKAKAA